MDFTKHYISKSLSAGDNLPEQEDIENLLKKYEELLKVYQGRVKEILTPLLILVEHGELIPKKSVEHINGLLNSYIEISEAHKKLQDYF